MEILNLDDLAKQERKLVLAGKDHFIVEMSVEDFIEATKEAKALEGQTERDVASNMGASIKHITRVIPTLTDAELRKLSVRQLLAIVQFINGKLDEEAMKGSDGTKN